MTAKVMDPERKIWISKKYSTVARQKKKLKEAGFWSRKVRQGRIRVSTSFNTNFTNSGKLLREQGVPHP